MRRLLVAMTVLVLLGCASESRDPGLAAELYVADAQFVAKPLPRPNGGPDVIAVRAPHTQILPALRTENLRGALAPEATSVLIGAAGDHGYFIVSAGAASIEEPAYPTFEATLSFGRGTPAGPLTLRVLAVDEAGRVGDAKELVFNAVSPPSEGPLVVRLRWDTEADLDLHVVPPKGDEIWARNVNSLEPSAPGAQGSDPNAWKNGGILSFDSNADCRIDGRREERVVWTVAPEPGAYRVRVATASLCGEAAAHWFVDAFRDGERVARGEGIATIYDARAGQSRGDGSFAIAFDVP